MYVVRAPIIFFHFYRLISHCFDDNRAAIHIHDFIETINRDGVLLPTIPKHTVKCDSGANGVEPTAQVNRLVATKKRRIGGRSKNGTEKFALFDSNDKRRARYACCAVQMSSIIWNSTSAKDHFLKCKRFQTKFPAAYEQMIRQEARDEAAEAEIAQRARETSEFSPQTGLNMTTNAKYKDGEKLICILVLSASKSDKNKTVNLPMPSPMKACH